MLPSPSRMRRSADFSAVLRGGRCTTTASTPTLVLHHRPELRETGPALVGLVVARTVGNSVVRHRVSRRLRAQLAARLSVLPAGSATVVRARPAAGSAASTELGRDLDSGFRRVLRAGSGSPAAREPEPR